jgi:predicted nucleic acid-binding Zn ribbon protein
MICVKERDDLLRIVLLLLCFTFPNVCKDKWSVFDRKTRHKEGRIHRETDRCGEEREREREREGMKDFSFLLAVVVLLLVVLLGLLREQSEE